MVLLLWGPASGFQACGEIGDGRMLEPAQMLEEVIAALQPKVLKNRRILITAGPTFETRSIRFVASQTDRPAKWDTPSRVLPVKREASVTLISGPTALDTPYHVNRVDVMTAIEMRDAVMSHISHQDIFISVAAVADWRVANASDQKIKKNKNGDTPTLEFTENPDILHKLPLQHCLILHIASALPPNRKN